MTAKDTTGSRYCILAGGIALAFFVIAVTLWPWPLGFTSSTTGNPELAQSVSQHIEPGYRHTAAFALVQPGMDPEFAGFGAHEHDEFEIGSITKTFTAHLYADALSRGEVTQTSQLEDFFPTLAQTPAGNLTLESLATHTSGLERSLDSPESRDIPFIFLRLRGIEPTLDGLLSTANDAAPDPGSYEYSNLGIALLGQALAQATHTPYPELVTTRLLEPLGMNETTVPELKSDLPPNTPLGRTATGIPSGPWTLGAQAPAGSIRSTAHDMGLWLQAVSQGSAPGSAATAARADADAGTEIGYAWYITDGLTWHNGGTGGFRSWAGFDPDGHGLVVLSDSAVSVDGVSNYLSAPR